MTLSGSGPPDSITNNTSIFRRKSWAALRKSISAFPEPGCRDIYYAKYYGLWGGMDAGERNKDVRVQEKSEKGERKTEENYIKNGERVRPDRRKLIRRGKK